MSAGYVYILGALLLVKGVFKCCYTYRRGLLRCSFRLDWAMRRPCRAGRVTGTDSRAFFIYRYYNSDLTHKNRPVRESAEGHRLTRQAASTSCGFPSSIC